MAPPGYQDILDRQIPAVTLPDGARQRARDRRRVRGRKGPAQTFTPIQVWDLRLARARADRARAAGRPHDGARRAATARCASNGSEPIREAEVALFDRAGERLRHRGRARTPTALLLCGEPIGEPIVGQGPFVMNRPEEIRQAIRDYQSGKMGHLD